MRGLLARQSDIFAQLPEKLASYNRRFREIALATQSELSRESQSRLEAHWKLARTLYGRASDDAAATGETALLVGTTGGMPASFEDAGTATRQVVEPVDTDAEAVGDRAAGPAAPNRADEDVLRKP
jgi:hypothetical protein